MARKIARAAWSHWLRRRILARAANPKCPRTLARHECLRYTLTQNSEAWEFERDGTITSVPAHARSRSQRRFHCSSRDRGAGVARLPTSSLPIICAADAAARPSRMDAAANRLYAVYPHTRMLPAKTRRLIDFWSNVSDPNRIGIAICRSPSRSGRGEESRCLCATSPSPACGEGGVRQSESPFQ